MLKRALALPVAILTLTWTSGGKTELSADVAKPLMSSLEADDDVCLMPPTLEQRAEYQASIAAYQSRRGGAAAGQKESDGAPPGWPGKNTIGGNIPPTAAIMDPWPTFDGIAVDGENGIVAMSDENRHGLLIYDTASGGASSKVTPPRGWVIGPSVKLGFVAGVTVNPKRREILVTNNDGGGVEVFPYDSNGDTKPIRSLTVPHQSWGMSLDPDHDELAVTSQQYQGISIYSAEDAGVVRPRRTIRGMATKLEDPHGVFLYGARDEVFAANHGNWTEMKSYAGDEPAFPGKYIPGRFEPSSIRVYKASANGDVPPIRTLQGNKTQLAWPMGITVDKERNELLVANYASNSILIFPVTAEGDTAPARFIGGPHTGIVGPVGVSIDAKRNEIWVANYGDHTAVVFDRTASGDAAPKRIIRNAPEGTPTTGFTNAASAAYDPKRQEVLVPNCVSVPRISGFARYASGNVAPDRTIEGQQTHLSRTMHGLAFDPVHDEIIVPVALSGAVLVFKGDARGNTMPIRIIQGSHTGLIRPQTVEVDPVNNEIVAADSSSRAILVFDRMANGDVAPKRKIGGLKTDFRDIVGVAVDPVANVIIAANRSAGGPNGLYMFDRLADGDVAPIRHIGGINTGVLGRFRQLKVDSERGMIYVAVQAFRRQQATPQKEADLYTNEKALAALRAQAKKEDSDDDNVDQEGGGDTAGFIGVWSVKDDGDVPPRMMIRGGATRANGFGGVAINPKDGEVYGVGSNAVMTYLVPKFFVKGPATPSAGGR
jgi:DNA-binding beta-propeller fold protein YncE